MYICVAKRCKCNFYRKKLKGDRNLKYQYAIACPTSMGVRITPPERMAVQNSNTFLYAGDQRGDERAERRVEPWAGVPCTYEIRQGQPRCGFHQAAAPRTEHPL